MLKQNQITSGINANAVSRCIQKSLDAFPDVPSPLALASGERKSFMSSPYAISHVNSVKVIEVTITALPDLCADSRSRPWPISQNKCRTPLQK